MNKVDKAIAKLSKEYREAFDFLMYKLKARDFTGLKISKLKGQKDVYRFKHGRLRVIYFYNGISLQILDVGLRNDNTYRSF